ncbi:NADP-dependent oxidoreductase [Winogradskya consettensis]|uniref:Oxidoreductase n=1 Tax=Winogradskya consettensis TaxID=113560 RepID=A0A919VSW1_9ACTN|nr:NADP-dependent oxidoreductase [Actinoplanes consettensis]GIM75266.1 putative oxidoreductase [Actinoplanes consettensis]
MNNQSRAVRFDRYGGPEVLHVESIPTPVPAEGEVVVEVRAAGINPGEIGIRSGAMRDRYPATFPSGQGSDLAGVVVALGAGVTEFREGDEVLGYSWQRSSQATHVAVPVHQLIIRPVELSWEQAGGLYVVAATAYAAIRAVDPQPGETVAVSAAAGGVGTLVVQLLRRRGVEVIGIASAANDEWLRERGVVPVHYGDDLAEQLADRKIDAFIDLFGPQYVRLAVDLGIPRDRIETIIAFALAQELGVKAEGSMLASTREVLTEMAGLVADGSLELLVAATYPLDKVADAFTELEKRHTRGKIVLIP